MSQQNNDQELRDIYERYSSLVYGRCRFILRSNDEAWDATQEVFMKLMRSLPGIKDRSAIYSWLLSTSTDLHSKEGGRLPEEKRVVLREIIKTLFRPWDKKVREVVMYSYIYEYSQKEISQLTGLGESTIRKYLTLFKRGSRHAFADFKEAING
jgi:DNA-directed RNA polymerase specialized sigma24 family protein